MTKLRKKILLLSIGFIIVGTLQCSDNNPKVVVSNIYNKELNITFRKYDMYISEKIVNGIYEMKNNKKRVNSKLINKDRECKKIILHKIFREWLHNVL